MASITMRMSFIAQEIIRSCLVLNALFAVNLLREMLFPYAMKLSMKSVLSVHNAGSYFYHLHD